jgi:hypothetical protein
MNGPHGKRRLEEELDTTMDLERTRAAARVGSTSSGARRCGGEQGRDGDAMRDGAGGKYLPWPALARIRPATWACTVAMQVGDCSGTRQQVPTATAAASGAVGPRGRCARALVRGRPGRVGLDPNRRRPGLLLTWAGPV